MGWIAGAGAILVLVVVFDLLQRKHTIIRNFPLIGHFRYILEAIGPELRQYIVTNNDEERPFSRDQRRWIYASSKKENNYFGFGTDNDIESKSGYLIFKHSSFPLNAERGAAAESKALYPLPCAKVLGKTHGRAKAFRLPSAVNVSGMSYGSLGKSAVQALNGGCALAGCAQNTGEGSISPYHLQGGDLVWQIGTGYFGCREANGGFSFERFHDVVEQHDQIRAIEIKLSQGAKPGLGGLLPAKKITAEIAATRGIPMGQDCHSPAAHQEFSDVDGLLDFIERLANDSGLPVGIKSAVGGNEFWVELAKRINETGRGPDFITIDGGEGGTGAAPLVFSDHVALPFKIGFPRVYRIFAEAGLHEGIVFNGSGRLGLPENAVLAFVLGCDMISVAREAMMAIGCIQAQRCHTGRCPAGVATHNRWLVQGLDPTLKSARLANYIATLRKEILQISRACGVCHPALLTEAHCEIANGQLRSVGIQELFGYSPGYGLPGSDDRETITNLMQSTDLVSQRTQ